MPSKRQEQQANKFPPGYLSNGYAELVRKAEDTVQTEISDYDRFASGLTAGTFTLAMIASSLLLIWATSLSYERFTIPILPPPIGESLTPVGFALDIETPGEEENPELVDPALADAIKAIDFIATAIAIDSDTSGQDKASSSGKGKGDKRKKNPGSGQSEIKPWQKWDIQFSAATEDEYSKQIDGLGVELAAAQKKGDNIVYIKGVNKVSPKIRNGKKEAEKRLYFVPSSSRVRLWDRNIAVKSGVKDAKNRIIVQIFPEKVVKNMTKWETNQLKKLGRKRAEIKRSVFMISRVGESFTVKGLKIKFLN